MLAVTRWEEIQGFSRTGSIVKARFIDAIRAGPNPSGLSDYKQLIKRNQKSKPIVFPEDKLYSKLYKRLPILEYEIGAGMQTITHIIL